MSHFFQHIHTVQTHRRGVRKLCFKCGLIKQGLTHDLSKFSPSEFWTSVHYWTGTCSPLDMEIKDKGVSEAWLHHKGRNKHHYEYWLDPTHFDKPCRMPIKYVAEMFCDRTAASKTYMKEKYNDAAPLNYMLTRKKEPYLMNEETFALLKGLFEILAEKGEDEACRFIREMVKHGTYEWAREHL